MYEKRRCTSLQDARAHDQVPMQLDSFALLVGLHGRCPHRGKFDGAARLKSAIALTAAERRTLRACRACCVECLFLYYLTLGLIDFRQSRGYVLIISRRMNQPINLKVKRLWIWKIINLQLPALADRFHYELAVPEQSAGC
jgi:hypothetical protein